MFADLWCFGVGWPGGGCDGVFCFFLLLGFDINTNDFFLDLTKNAGGR